MSMSEIQRKCPLCNGGNLVRSRSSSAGYTFYFWKKPWKRNFFDTGVERVFPWACMGCGVVLLYLDRLPAVALDYRTAREEESGAVVAPEPIQP